MSYLKRTMHNIGIEQYDFDFQKEKVIYGYVYGINETKKEWSKLTGKEKFPCYNDWEQYIRRKYKDYDIEFLKGFSRYLNQRTRNVRPSTEYWAIYIPILLSLVFDNGLERN